MLKASVTMEVVCGCLLECLLPWAVPVICALNCASVLLLWKAALWVKVELELVNALSWIAMNVMSIVVSVVCFQGFQCTLCQEGVWSHWGLKLRGIFSSSSFLITILASFANWPSGRDLFARMAFTHWDWTSCSSCKAKGIDFLKNCCTFKHEWLKKFCSNL